MPTPEGEIKLYVNEKEIKVTATQGKGWVNIKSRTAPKSSYGKVEKTGKDTYRLWLDTNKEVTIKYKSI